MLESLLCAFLTPSSYNRPTYFTSQKKFRQQQLISNYNKNDCYLHIDRRRVLHNPFHHSSDISWLNRVHPVSRFHTLSQHLRNNQALNLSNKTQTVSDTRIGARFSALMLSEETHLDIMVQKFLCCFSGFCT